MEPEQLADIVHVVHYIVVAYIVLPPLLTSNQTVLTVHLFVLAAVMIHWATNNDKCWLTQLEKKLRNQPESNTSLVGTKCNLSDRSMWMILIGLMALTCWKLGFI